MLKNAKRNLSWNFVLAALAVLCFWIYSLTSAGQTPYDYFTRLADSFLQGKYYLTQNPPWLNELIPIGQNKFAVVYPPGPALISTPFVAIFKDRFHQENLSWIMGSIATYAWGVIAFNLTKNKLISLFIFVMAGFGNIHWYLAATGSVWYLGQVSGFMFLTLAIHESIAKKRLPLITFYFCLAVLSRIQLLLAFPFLIYINRSQVKNVQSVLISAIEALFFIIIFGVYNYLRFGSPIETGYGLIPGVLDEPWYQKGIFHYSYIRENLRVMFLSMPNFKETFPFITPSWGGLSILITSPVFIYIFFAKLNNKLNLFAWLSLFFVAAVVFSHGGTGFTQFGYRYAVDFYPLIFFLLVQSLKNVALRWHHILLLTVSVIVNMWGVLFINKFGFVSF